MKRSMGYRLSPILVVLLAFWPWVWDLPGDEPAGEKAGPRHFMTVTVQSWDALLRAAGRIADALVPGMGMQVQGMLPAVLGVPGLQGLERGKPVFVTFGFQGEKKPPLAVFHLPVEDVDRFVGGLGQRGLFAGAKNWTRHAAGGYLVTSRAAKEISVLQAAARWVRPAERPSRLLAVDVRVEPVRAALLHGLDALKGLAAAGMMAAGGQVAGDPRDLQAVVEWYVKAAKAVVNGSERILLTADVNDAGITFRAVVYPVKGTPLAGFMNPPSLDVRPMTAYLDDDAFISCAGVMDKHEDLLAACRKIMVLSMKMQGMTPASSEEAAKEMARSMEQAFPCRFALSLDMTEKGYSYVYLLRMDRARAAESFTALKRFYRRMAAVLPGKGLYESVTFQPGVRTVDGVRVSRFTLVVDAKNPRMKALAMFPGFTRMEYDCARMGDTILVASPALMEKVIARVKEGAGKPRAVEPGTVLLGTFNLFSFLKGIGGMVPMLPPQVKAVFRQVRAEGTAVGYVVKAGGRMEATVTVPLALLTQAGKLFMQMRAIKGGAAPPGPSPAPRAPANKEEAPIF